MIALYSAGPFGNSLKVLIAIAEKGIAAEIRPVNALTLEQYREPLASRLPNGSLPVLVEGTLTLAESSIINEYLDETQNGPALMPATPAERWQARTWFKFVNEDLAPAVAILAWREWALPALSPETIDVIRTQLAHIAAEERRLHWRSALEGLPQAQVEWAEAKIAGFLTLTEERLQKTDYLAGTAFSLADIDVWPFLEPLRRLRPALIEAAPRTASWIDRTAGREAVISASEGYRDVLWLPGPELIRWG